MTHRYITDNTMQTRSTNDVVTPDDDNNDDNDVSNCSTPYVSAPSSPSNNHNHNNQNQFRAASSSAFFFYSAPSSPMHYVARSHLNPSASHTAAAAPPSLSSPTSFDFDFEFEFEFGSSFDSPAPSADELFLNGQIRPFKLHDIISEEHDHDHEDDIIIRRSREDAKLCGSRSQRRRTRSMSPLRSATPFDDEASAAEKAAGEEEEAPSGSSSRCSSAGRSSKRWVFLKDFLRSKSEGRSNNKFWHTFSSPASKEKDKTTTTAKKNKVVVEKAKVGTAAAGKRRSAHEMHYAANRAQAEEMRKKTFLPYRQGLLGCLGFNSKSYGALHGFARALNPVSSR